jgi:hypothetical protein
MASDDITITVSPLSVSESTFKPMIYPNPCSGSFTVEGNANYQLINSIGQVVLSGVCEGKSQIDVQGLQQGVYFLRLSNESGSKVEKLIIE